MPKRQFSGGAVEVGNPSREAAANAVWERRESERLVTDWEQETRRLGNALALLAVDIPAMTGSKWAYRFIITVDPVVEDSSLLFYGPGLAALLQLPEKPQNSVVMLRQLPARYVPVLTRGCITSALSAVPVRMQGAVDREDGRQELYRAAFIRASLDTSQRRHLALGALNCRVVERGAGHLA